MEKISDFVVGVGLFATIVYFRRLWEYDPNIIHCAAFWAFLFLFIIWIGRPLTYLLVGLSCNALATLLNFGRMPVHGLSAELKLALPEGKIHVVGNSDHYLWWLSDFMFGVSPGDILIVASIIFIVRYELQSHIKRGKVDAIIYHGICRHLPFNGYSNRKLSPSSRSEFNSSI